MVSCTLHRRALLTYQRNIIIVIAPALGFHALCACSPALFGLVRLQRLQRPKLLPEVYVVTFDLDQQR